MESTQSLARPTRQDNIYDAVKDAGIDVSAWHDCTCPHKANPKFCYRWAFEGTSSIVLCLWYQTLNEVDGVFRCSGNARQDQIAREAEGSDHWDPAVRKRTKRWAISAYQMDEVLKQAHRKKLTVRVCVVDSKASAEALGVASADYRELDPIPWQLSYDMMSGDFLVSRCASLPLEAQRAPEIATLAPRVAKPEAPLEGLEFSLPDITPSSYGVGVVDQFIGGQPEPTFVEKWEKLRSAKVRQMVMLRSQGCCEWCYKPGFMKHDGQIYLESHHVIPLSEEGIDHITNVIALCPNDHRMAHYGQTREAMSQEMLVRIQERISQALLQTEQRPCTP